ncbi:MAG TPA: PrsW family intramembrane metalloprotease [Terrimicrobiaceae bacterium]|nr:PrsW family intramembrane metalloprotease [Terrimicrobiaceae bacterium]
MGRSADSTRERLLVGSPLRKRRVAIPVILALVATFLLCIAVIFAAVGSLKAEAARLFVVGLLFSAGLSIVPVFILRYLDRRERESPWLFAIAIMWGAVIATGIALPINTGVILGVERWLAQYPQIGEYLGPQGPLLLGAPLAAPPIEELTKALGVLLLFAFLRAEFDNMRDGFVYGALVGVGFNLVEAPLYVAQAYAQYQVAPWGFQYGARFALFGLGGHAMFTGIFGAFLGIARQTTRYWLRLVAPLIGLALAILAHTFNNGLGLIITILLRESGEELPELGPPPQTPFLEAWVVASLQNLLLFLPFVLIVLVALRASGKWERRVIEEQLASEVGGAVTPEEFAEIRRDGIFRTRRLKGVDRRRSAALVNAQHELAFRKQAIVAEGGNPESDELVASWRREIADLRA